MPTSTILLRQLEHSFGADEAPGIQSDGKPVKKKWFSRRYQFFSRYDKGVQLDHDSWSQVTPEVIAQEQARYLSGDILIDPFVGVGGNAIPLCNHAFVIGCDISFERLEMAGANAGVYEVNASSFPLVTAKNVLLDRGRPTKKRKLNTAILPQGSLDLIAADFDTAIRLFRPRVFDGVMLSPPWGPAVYSQKYFDMSSMGSLDGRRIFRESAESLCPNIAYYLPFNVRIKVLRKLGSFLRTLVSKAEEGEQCVCVQKHRRRPRSGIGDIEVGGPIYLRLGRVAAITAYFGKCSQSISELSRI